MFKKIFFALFLISLCFAMNKVSANTGNSTKSSDEEFLITAHGISLLIIWGILVEIPIEAIRSYKAVKIHLALFIILDLWTLTSVFFVSKQSIDIK